MELSSDLISQFAKVTKPEEKPSEGKIVNGTAVAYEGTIYVRLDGSDQLTPVISSTAGMKSGDRVTVMIKDHSATVTGNTSDPSASSGDLSDTNDKVDQIGNQISEFEIVIADKVSVKEFDAEKARIDDLVAENVTIKDKLTATEADIGELTADNVTINEKLTAAEADIENLEATKISADIADLKYATIENLEATNADIHNLEADYGDFKVLTTGKFEATEADIQDLEVKKLSAEEAELKYANIDFSNIGKAAIEEFFSKSGMISDLVVGEGTITGKLVGVTIVGDLIEGGTVKADKLVVQGSDGLYYKLNVSGETVAAEQTEYNSLNGSIITAKSVTAEKISVKDLVAFGATIGGFHITDSAIYSGVKESVDNTTRGTYLDDEGQFAIGDSKNFLKYYKASDGTYKLEVSAGSIRFGVKGESVEDVVNDVKENAITSSVEEFYLSNSPTSLSEGSWSATQPTWTQGKYIWRRTMITYGDGRTEYSPNQNGVCITGNTGATGADGSDGKGVSSITNYYLATSSSSGVTVSTSGWTTTVQSVSSSKKYLWNYEKITYTDNTTSSTDPCIIGAYGDSGSDGSSGKDGVGISSITEYYQVSTSNSTAPTTWQTTVPTLTATNKYLWNYEKVQYTNNNSEETAKRVIGVYGDKGATGATGATGNGVKSSAVTYQASTSGTTIPTGSWVTSIPSVAAGSYLWTRTVITYTNGSTTTSYSVGRMGTNGTNGSAGKGVKSTAITYQAHSSQTSAPTGTWASSIPTLSTSKPYLWTRTVITYTDNTTSTSYSVSSTLESFEVGGRNYFSCLGEDVDGDGNGGKAFNGNKEYTLDDYQNVGSFTPFYNLTVPMSTFVGKECVLSFDVISPNGSTPISVYNSNSSPRYLMSVSGIVSPISTTWTKQKLNITVTDRGTSTSYSEKTSNKIEIYCSGKMGCKVRNVKFEIGNKATDWTPAPEDMATSEDISNVQDSIDETNDRIDSSEAKIELLNDSISTLVKDANGESLMEQTSTGWTFNIGSLQNQINDAANSVNQVEKDLANTTALVNKANSLLNDVTAKTAYINMATDESGSPCIELGKSGNPFKLRITNTSIDFMQDSAKIAYITNKQLYIQSSVVTDEMKIGVNGGFIWKKRANGNLGLSWESD